MSDQNSIYRYLLAIQEIRTAIQEDPRSSITKIAKQNRVSNNIGQALTRLGMIKNTGSKRRPVYVWTGNDMVFKDDVLSVIKEEYIIQEEYKKKRESKKPKVSVEPGFDFEQYDKVILVKDGVFTVLTPKQ